MIRKLKTAVGENDMKTGFFPGRAVPYLLLLLTVGCGGGGGGGSGTGSFGHPAKTNAIMTKKIIKFKFFITYLLFVEKIWYKKASVLNIRNSKSIQL